MSDEYNAGVLDGLESAERAAAGRIRDLEHALAAEQGRASVVLVRAALDLVAGALTDAATVPVPDAYERLHEGVRELTRQRDEAKRGWMRDVSHERGTGSDADARYYAEVQWGTAEAARLFPEEVNRD